MTTTYYKDKVIKLQQELDKRDEEIKRLNNELLLCEESKKNPDVGLYSKKNVTTTPMVKFSSPQVERILKDREKAIKRNNRKIL
jgi:superfamily I DNA and/or RNA helicase